MTTKRQVAVLGVGKFGLAVARELMHLGHDVLAVDADEKVVQGIADEVTHAVRADITDRDVLEELGLAQFDTVIIGTADDIKASIFATVLLKQLGAQRIVAKAADELHGSILEQIGADRVVYPERETGMRVAHSFAAFGVQDYLDVAPGYGFACAPVTEALAGKSLRELDLPRTCGVTVVALSRGGSVTLYPAESEVLQLGDQLTVAGRDEALERLPGRSRGLRTED